MHPFGECHGILVMGNGGNKHWYHVLRDKILGRGGLFGGSGEDGSGAEKTLQATVGDCAGVPAIPDKGKAENNHVRYTPPQGPEPEPPQVLGAVPDGTAMMYVQTCYWVAEYVRFRAKRGDFTEDQLIEQFGVNVRRCMNPDWKGQG